MAAFETKLKGSFVIDSSADNPKFMRRYEYARRENRSTALSNR